ncbi:hypothetical protein L9F63_000869, partial [Diploptera punctata]
KTTLPSFSHIEAGEIYIVISYFLGEKILSESHIFLSETKKNYFLLLTTFERQSRVDIQKALHRSNERNFRNGAADGVSSSSKYLATGVAITYEWSNKIQHAGVHSIHHVVRHCRRFPPSLYFTALVTNERKIYDSHNFREIESNKLLFSTIFCLRSIPLDGPTIIGQHIRIPFAL